MGADAEDADGFFAPGVIKSFQAGESSLIELAKNLR